MCCVYQWTERVSIHPLTQQLTAYKALLNFIKNYEECVRLKVQTFEKSSGTYQPFVCVM